MLNYTAVNSLQPAGNPRTLFQVRPPSNQRVTIWGVDIGLQGADVASTPILFDWVTQTTSGVASDLIGIKQDRGLPEAIQGAMQKNFTTEPTLGSRLMEISIHQQGTLPWYGGFPIIAGGGERVGLRYRSGTFVNVTFTVYMTE